MCSSDLLTISHKIRIKTNDTRNWQERLGKQAVFLGVPEPSGKGNQPQSMWVWPGLQLIGAGHRCLKGFFYEVAGVDSESVILTSGLQLTHEQAVKSLRLSYCITYASCQGLTLPGVVRLDTRSSHFTLKHLYVGLSRATAASLVEVN